jgi:hypothetical protein
MKPSPKSVFDHVERTKAGGVSGFRYHFCPGDHLRRPSFLLQNHDSQEASAPRLLEPSGLGTLWISFVVKLRAWTDVSQIIDFAFSFSLFYATAKGLGLPAADIKPENRGSITRATFSFTVLYVSLLRVPVMLNSKMAHSHPR